MIEGSWPYVLASYGVTLASLAVLAVAQLLRLRHWSKRARALGKEVNP